jgi:flagellar hook-basal body complex protein FliE
MESLKFNHDFYNILFISGVDLRDYEALADKLEVVLKNSFTDKNKNSFKIFLKNFTIKVSEKWQKAQRKDVRFLSEQESWLCLPFFSQMM